MSTTSPPTGYWGHHQVRRGATAADLFLRAFVPFVIVLLIAGSASLILRIRTLDRDLDLTGDAFIALAAQRFERDLRTPLEDLRFLTRALHGDAASLDSDRAEALNLSYARPRYDTVRILDRAGVERLRVTGHGDAAHATPQSELSDWARSNLYSKLTRMRDGDVYVSSFELRTEHGQVVEPFEPLLRFAAPLVAANGERAGYVLIDFDAAASLSDLQDAYPHGVAELLTSEGYWVKAHDPLLEWGAVLGERERQLFSTLNASAWSDMLHAHAGRTRTERGAFWYRTVQPPHASIDSPMWKLVLIVPREQLHKRNHGVLAGLALLGLAAAAIVAPFLWWLAHKARTSTFN